MRKPCVAGGLSPSNSTWELLSWSGGQWGTCERGHTAVRVTTGSQPQPAVQSTWSVQEEINAEKNKNTFQSHGKLKQNQERLLDDMVCVGAVEGRMSEAYITPPLLGLVQLRPFLRLGLFFFGLFFFTFHLWVCSVDSKFALFLVLWSGLNCYFWKWWACISSEMDS